MKRQVVFIIVAGLLYFSGVKLAADDAVLPPQVGNPPPAVENPGTVPDVMGKDNMDGIRDLVRKFRAGEKLTPEEMDQLKQLKEKLGKRFGNAGGGNLGNILKGMRKGKGPKEEEYIPYQQLNAIDRAHYSVVEILVEDQNYEEAAKELQKIINESPDEEAVNITHFNLGAVYKKFLGDNQKAIEEFNKVKGEHKMRAAGEIMKIYGDTGEMDKASQLMEECLKESNNSQEKLRILDMMAGLYRKNGDKDKAIELLRRFPQVMTYDEAIKANQDMKEGGRAKWRDVRRALVLMR